MRSIEAGPKQDAIFPDQPLHGPEANVEFMEAIGVKYFNLALRGIETLFRDGDPPEIHLLRLTDANRIFDPISREIFRLLFPDDEHIYRQFEQVTIKQHEYSPAGRFKDGFRMLMRHLGISTPKKIQNDRESDFYEDDHEHQFSLNTKKGALAGDLSRISALRRLDDVAMSDFTDPEFIQKQGNSAPASRGLHWQEVMVATARDIMRQAIVDGDRLDWTIINNLKYWSMVHNQGKNGRSFELVISRESKAIARKAVRVMGLDSKRVNQIARALEYAKLAMIVAAFHDVYTPGFGDPAMRATGINENAELAAKIDNLLLESDVNEVMLSHRINTTLLATIIRNCALGKDISLIGLLVKHKNQLDSDEQDKFGYYNTEQALDNDQVGGNILSATKRLAKFAPAGVKRINKDKPGQQVAMPLGNLMLRLRLFYWMALTGIDAETLSQFLRNNFNHLRINPAQLYIGLEELQIGRRITLERIQFDPKERKILSGKQIDPSRPTHMVPVCPFDLAESLTTLLWANYAFFYLGTGKRTTEQMMIEFIRAALKPKHAGPGQWLGIEDFEGKTDKETRERLNEVVPVATYLLTLADQAVTYTEEQLMELAGVREDGVYVMPDCLIVADNIYDMLPPKLGTYVRARDGSIGTVGDVSRELEEMEREQSKLNSPPEIPGPYHTNLWKRFDSICQYLYSIRERHGQVYRVIFLEDKDKNAIGNMLSNPNHNTAVMLDVLEKLTKVQLRNGVIIYSSLNFKSDLDFEQFYLE